MYSTEGMLHFCDIVGHMMDSDKESEIQMCWPSSD